MSQNQNNYLTMVHPNTRTRQAEGIMPPPPPPIPSHSHHGGAAHRHRHHQEGRSLEVEAKVETMRTMKIGPMVRTIQRINTSFDTHQETLICLPSLLMVATPRG